MTRMKKPVSLLLAMLMVVSLFVFLLFNTLNCRKIGRKI